MDLIAAKLNLDPAEVRRRNFVQPGEMPYHAGILYRDGEPICYDSGNYPETLAQALKATGYEELRRRQAELRQHGRYLGIGIGCYVEGTGVGSFEGAKVRIDPSGQIVVATGATGHGQGHETIFAQIAADLWGVRPGRCSPGRRRHLVDPVRLRHVWQPQHGQRRLRSVRSFGAPERKGFAACGAPAGSQSR